MTDPISIIVALIIAGIIVAAKIAQWQARDYNPERTRRETEWTAQQ